MFPGLQKNTTASWWQHLKLKLQFSRQQWLGFILAMLGGMISTYGLFNLLDTGQQPVLAMEAPSLDTVCPVATESASQAELGLVIDVAGAVLEPGMYKLPKGSRVSDAISAAGGLDQSADGYFVAQILNLAETVSDEQKLYVPKSGEVYQDSGTHLTSTEVTTSSETISINSATQEQLEGLPGIGEKRATDIIASRPYGSVEELVTNGVLGQGTYEKIESSISL